MDIQINVVNQKLRIASNLKYLVSGTQEFVNFVFNLSDDWSGLTVFAQFTQNGTSYNQYLDADNSCYLPAEIVAGTCTLVLYGSGSNTIATTNYLTLDITENNIVSDAQSTEITLSLYNQMVNKVNEEITRAKAAESSLDSAKLAKTGDSQNNTVTFTSGDAADSSVSRTTGWSAVAALTSGLTHSALFNRISTMMKNVRYLYKLIGTTDISSLSTAGTVTGAISKLNTDLTDTLKKVTWTNNVDLNNLTTDGIYYLGNGLTNAPSTSIWSPMRVYKPTSVSAIRQIIYHRSGATGETYTMSRAYQDNAWTDWTTQPTRSEVDKLNTDVNSKSSTYLTVTNGSGHVSFYKKGSYCQVRTADFTFTPTATGWFSVITVPSDYKPYITVNFLSINNSASSSSGLPIQTRMEENGDLKFYVTSGIVNTTVSVVMSFTYLMTY